MSNIKLDLSKVKHLKSDEESTTLAHQDGHTITLLHKSLGPDSRKQLEALAKVSKKMAKGGPVRTEAEEEPSFVDTLTKDLPQRSEPDIDSSEIDPMAGLKEQYNIEQSMLDSGPTTPIGSSGYDASGLEGMFGPKGEAPEQFNPEAWKKAENTLARRTEQESRQQLQTSANIQAENEVRARAGLPLLPVPAGIPQAQPVPQEVQPLIAEPQAVPQQPSVAPTGDGFALQEKAIRDTAKAQMDLAAEQAAIQNKAIQDAEIAKQEYKIAYDKINEELEHNMADVRAGYIDPDKYWTGYRDPVSGKTVGGHSRLMAGIGMLIAGFNPTSQPNAAIEFIKHQMNQNLEAQKANLQSAHNLVAANMRQFGNLKDATEMAKLQQMGIVQMYLQQAAAKAQSPMAKAAADNAIGMLQREKAASMNKFAMQGAIQRMSKDPAQMDALISALEQTDPQRAKEYRERSVPGLGFASSAEGAKGLREMQTTVKTVRNGLNRLKEITKTTGKSMSPTLRKEANSIRTELIGKLRLPMTGPGAMSDGERELLMALIPGVADLTSLDSRSLKAIETLDKRITDNYRNMAVANGLSVPQAPQESDSTAKARAWLKANPKHPKAAGVRKALGE